MEEKKSSKEIKMETAPKQQKLSYEELNQTCAELSQQNQQMQAYIRKLHVQLQQLGEANMLKRLDYLFKVLEYKDLFDGDFVGDCVAEIKEAMIIPEKKEEEQKPQ